MVRQAAAQLDARVAESRALLHSASGSTLEEFRHQAEVQVDLAISETTERSNPRSPLSMRKVAPPQTRRRTMIDDVTRTTEQSTEQFRSGIKAFLYSCLVAPSAPSIDTQKPRSTASSRIPTVLRAPSTTSKLFPPTKKSPTELLSLSARPKQIRDAP